VLLIVRFACLVLRFADALLRNSYNASTHATAIYFVNNNVLTSSVSGPTLPAGWSSVGVADFNQDGKVDFLLFNPVTRQRLNLSSSKPFNGISNLEALRPLAGSFKKSRTAGSL
jgi:FG-GAP repeat protein